MAKKRADASKVEANPKVDQLKMDYNGTFGTEAGQRVLADIMTLCHVLEPEADNIVENIVARAHRRDVAHLIMARMGYVPQDFPKTIEENSDG